MAKFADKKDLVATCESTQ